MGCSIQKFCRVSTKNGYRNDPKCSYSLAIQLAHSSDISTLGKIMEKIDLAHMIKK